MNKFDKMIEVKCDINRKKEEKAISAITYLLEKEKLISICELVKITGLSRSFFYQNKKVVSVLREAKKRETKKDALLSKPVIFNLALEEKNKILEEIVKKLKAKCKELEKENNELKKQLNRLV